MSEKSEKAEKKKRGGAKKEKKPIRVVAVVTPDGIEGTFSPEPRKPLIVHLPFSSAEVEFTNATEFRYDPNPPTQPEPYEDEKQLYFQVNSDQSTRETEVGVEQEGWVMDHQSEKNTTPQEEALPQPQQAQPQQTQIQQQVPLQLIKTAKNGEAFTPPEKTEIACFWCTCEFENQPAFLPVKEESGVYHIYGNFCTPQCGLAFLLHESLDSHVRWERMSLLHRMYKAAGRIYPAPPREALKKFGGTYTYAEYRSIIDQKKTRIDIHVPPLVSILSTLDTKPIDFYDNSSQNTFSSGFSLDRFKSWSEHGGALRLKRSKPLKDRESTLDACIQISIKRANENTGLKIDF